MNNLKEYFNSLQNDNCSLDTTPFELQYQITNPNLYEVVSLDDLKEGKRYRYCFTKDTYPEAITIISNQYDNLIITNPFVPGKEWIIKKSEVKSEKDIFYKKNYYSHRANYINLKEGLKFEDGKTNPVIKYLFDDENIIKEISSFQNRI